MSDQSETSRGFVIGDIHGCARALRILIGKFELTEDSRVVVLGDAVDRGPDSKDVLDTLIQIRETCELIYIRGNHEEMMLDALDGLNRDQWEHHGGAQTIASYDGRLRNVPDDHLDLLESSVRYWEAPNEICVHANLEPGVELSRQRSRWLRWKKLTGQEFPHPSGKRIICGHSGEGYGAPMVKNGWICLDTMAYGGGYLSALNLETDEILQAKQSTGEFRRGVYVNEIEG